MNGAATLLRTAADAGVRVCFANPGTTELPFVVALDDVPDIRPVLGLFEGVCTGAADGFARMAGVPAMALFHLGPGLANGLANLHNARRARSPVLTVVGDHATDHHVNDAPLESDIATLAAPMSTWVGTALTATEMPARTLEAITAARQGGPATLIVPADAQWDTAAPPSAGASGPAGSAAASVPQGASSSDSVGACEWFRRRRAGASSGGSAGASSRSGHIVEAARLLAAGGPVAMLLGADALTPPALHAAQRIANATGCRLLSETFPARMERGTGLPAPQRLPYPLPQAGAVLGDLQALVLVGARAPVAFFAYPGQPRTPVPDAATVHALAEQSQDAVAALERLADRLAPGPAPVTSDTRTAVDLPASGALTPESIGAVLAALQPEGAIVVDEAITTGRAYFPLAADAPPHSYLALTGGSIGQGLPCATGAAVAAPDRPVIAFQADGSAMYTLQALWTQAREGLDVTTLLCANRSYRILQGELAHAGLADPGPAAAALTDLAGPAIDWVLLAEGLGVPGRRVTSVTELVPALRETLSNPGPQLLELVL
jgi:acetolactate synthase I/II/III large subunit